MAQRRVGAVGRFRRCPFDTEGQRVSLGKLPEHLLDGRLDALFLGVELVSPGFTCRDRKLLHERLLVLS